MDLVVHEGSAGEAEARVRGWRRKSLIRCGPLTFGCRLAAPTTKSPRPSPRKRGEEMRTTEPIGRKPSGIEGKEKARFSSEKRAFRWFFVSGKNGSSL
ncbi:hypothetical protein [Methylobacterium haplocladii]|nr:hypothetical protein [Methylobacterium haplocladii]GJD84748.1 hypothetical protein HPGCJGGD_2630 [Methylobacterium haplocladii]